MFAIKRKETVVKAIRRCARERLDQAIAALNRSPGDRDKSRAKVSNEVERLLAMLALVAPAMDTTAARREGKVLRAAARRAQQPWDAREYLGTRVKSAGTALSGVTAQAVLVDPEGLSIKPGKKRRRGPNPVVHRLIADLAEVRMRAGYWHVTGNGFEVLAPGLRSTYTRARRMVQTPDNPSDTAATLCRLAQQSRWLERCWPGVVEAQRQRVSGLVTLFMTMSTDERLLKALNDNAEATRLRDFLSTEKEAILKTSERERLALFLETPGRYVDRHAGYWAAWRET